MQLPILKNTSCSLLQRKESWMEMKAEIVAMTAEAIDKEAIARGGEILKRGGLVAFQQRQFTVLEEMPWILWPLKRFMRPRDVLLTIL